MAVYRVRTALHCPDLLCESELVVFITLLAKRKWYGNIENGRNDGDGVL